MGEIILRLRKFEKHIGEIILKLRKFETHMGEITVMFKTLGTGKLIFLIHMEANSFDQSSRKIHNTFRFSIQKPKGYK